MKLHLPISTLHNKTVHENTNWRGMVLFGTAKSSDGETPYDTLSILSIIKAKKALKCVGLYEDRSNYSVERMKERG